MSSRTSASGNLVQRLAALPSETYLGLLGYVFIGTAAVLVPSVMPFITEEYTAAGISLAAIALIFPARSAGAIVGNIFAGVGSDLVGAQRLVWLSALGLAMALFLTAASQMWLLFVVGFVFVSATQGALSTGINTMIADANRKARARALNTLHGVYGAGAAVSPLVIGYFLDQGVAWRWALGATGLLWLLYGVGAYLLYRESSGERSKSGKLDLSMLRDRPFLALFFIAFVYNGVAVSLLGWIAVIMQQSGDFSMFVSVSMISVFYVALTLGRFLCAAYAERRGYAFMLLVLSWGITLTYPIVVFGINSWVIVVGVFLTGLSLSGLFPTGLAFGSRLYPEQTGTVTATLNLAMTAGATLPPWWTGILADLWGFQTALAVNFVMVVPLVGIALYLGRVERDVMSDVMSNE